MTTIIYQADSIVGINPGATGLDERSRWWLRRGAYFEWLAGHGEMSEFAYDAPCSEMADRIVELHAASKPKGDGLPDELIVFCPNQTGMERVTVAKLMLGLKCGMTLEEQTATAVYIQRCLTPPVRRLLAAFEVVGEFPRGCLPFYIGRRDGMVCVGCDPSGHESPSDIICWLVPRGER